METKAVNPPVASSAHEPLLERLGFRGTVDDYVVTLRAPGVSKQDVAVLVMRSHAIVTVTPSAKAEKRRGNVVQLFPKNNRGKRCQLQFIDPVAQHGHTVSLKDGVLTLRFMKEKSAATAWAESVDVS
jgi:HSP20 family molecular chaperone IbpA